ncbi:RNA-directed DNA polymerase, eukaryota [Tanacetum coccineum]
MAGDKRSFLSKEDLTGKISKTIFVTNFPDHITARDLWNVCTAYGKVVDVYIPLKRSQNKLEAWAPEFNNEFCENSSSDEESMEDGEFNSQKVDDIDHISESSCMKEGNDNKTTTQNMKENVIVNKSNSNPSLEIRKTSSNGKCESNRSFKLKAGGSNLDVMKDLIEIGLGQTSKKDWIRELNLKYKVNFATIQETNPSVGLSGGILCVWNPNVFAKESVTVSDSFVAVRENERFGTIFNDIGAKAFNHFISSSCLIDLPLEGYSFTWALKSGSKMSKLDRFLISEGLISIFPSLAAICLDRRLSDHRPILLRESSVDYGPTPFRVFHSWFTKDGFDNLIADTWNNLSIMETNKISLLRKKFQALKAIIKNWSRDEMLKASAVRHSAQSRISELDKLIDKGLSNNDIINERISLLKDIHDLDKRHSSDLAQKAKIQSDENSKYFHGIINKKRSQLAIRGVLVDGEWIEDPPKVKNEFLEHFSNRFSMPTGQTINLDSHMFQKISIDQNADLESDVSLEEIKKAVWECGTNKSPGPDGWIQACLSSAMGSILVNGSPSSEFKFHKGLKQGDPLSPFLFILVMEKFAHFVQQYLEFRALQRLPRGSLEEEQFSKLIEDVNSVILSVSNDRWIWSLDLRGGNSRLNLLDCFIDDHLLLAVGAPTRWVSEAQLRLTSWLETVAGSQCSHLFFSCSMARNITTKLARWWEFDCPDLFSYDDWLEWFHTLRLLKDFKDILEWSLLMCATELTVVVLDAYTYPPLPRVPLSFQASDCSLSTLHFLKFPKNNFEVLKLLKNSVEVLKILENKL